MKIFILEWAKNEAWERRTYTWQTRCLKCRGKVVLNIKRQAVRKGYGETKGVEKKDALNTVLCLSEKQMRIALVDLVETFYPTKKLNQYDLEAILQAAKSHRQEQ